MYARVGRPRSQGILHRRRVVLVALVAVALASLVLALVASQAPVWGVQAIADTLLVTYLGALIHVRRLAAQREMDLSALRG